MITVKISIGFFFLKLFTTGFRWQRILVYTLVSISSIFGAIYLIMTFATCGIMVRSQATTPLHTGSDWCAIQDTFVNISIVWSVLNAVTDITFQALSVQILWNAKLNLGTKISASMLLVLGSIGGVASIARIVVQTPLNDIRLSGVLLVLWSNIEAGLCITAASAITLRPLFQTWVENTKLALSSINGQSVDSKQSSSSSTPFSSKRGLVEEDVEMGKCKGQVTITTVYEVKTSDADACSSRTSSTY